jgi:type IX secretion system PorP/SprF family membrane protein
MKKHLLFISLFILSSSNTIVFAQQDAQFTQFMLNRLYYNPGFAGIEGQTQYFFTHRTQWLGYTASFDDGGSPNTQIVSFNRYLPKLSSGLGFHIVNDLIGPLQNLELQLSYSYHVKLRNGAKLGIGLRGGIYGRAYDFGQLRFREPGDDFDTGAGKQTKLKPDAAIGLFYQDRKLFIAVSANHLAQIDYKYKGLNDIALSVEPLANTLYWMGGYTFEINQELTIMPTALVKTVEFKEISFDMGLMATFREQFWIGATYRNEESANILLGVNLPQKKNKDKIFKIGYSFDYVFAGQSAKQPTSHEITIGYTLPVPKPKITPIIRTPRFRY